MKRATFGSLLFVAGALLVLLVPTGESTAMADASKAKDDDGPNQSLVTASAKTVIPANAGLKPLVAADLGTTGSCPDGMVEVQGDYCPALEQKCVRWMDSETTIPRRCSESATAKAMSAASVPSIAT